MNSIHLINLANLLDPTTIQVSLKIMRDKITMVAKNKNIKKGQLSKMDRMVKRSKPASPSAAQSSPNITKIETI
jgi:hypothetical protein